MLNHYFIRPTTVDRIRASWIGEGIERYVVWLTVRRYYRARMGAVLAYIAQLYAVEKRARQCGIFGESLRLLLEQAAQPVIG